MLHLTYLERRKEKRFKLKTGALRHFGLILVCFAHQKHAVLYFMNHFSGQVKYSSTQLEYISRLIDNRHLYEHA